jgi:signal transduction histidine kinase
VNDAVNDMPWSTHWPFVMEDALRAYLSRRHKRAYAHDLRNGLQGIHGGMDALMARAARANKPSSVPLEQLTQFVRQAIANHEHGLERVLEGMAPNDETVEPIDLKAFLSDLLKFLTNDAARHGVRLKMEIAEGTVAHAAPAKLRLICLGLLTDAIDALPAGGDIRISGQAADTHIQIDFADSRSDGPVDSPADSFLAQAVDHLVAQLSWRIERKPATGTGHQVRVELPRRLG